MTTQPLPPARTAALAQLATAAWQPATDAVEIACQELAGIIDRLCGVSPVLVIERESETFWTVTNTATGLVMFRTPDLDTAERFARAFVAKTPGARLDAGSLGRARYSDLFSVKVGTLPEEGKPEAAAAVGPYPSSGSVRSNVIPLIERKPKCLTSSCSSTP